MKFVNRGGGGCASDSFGGGNKVVALVALRESFAVVVAKKEMWCAKFEAVCNSSAREMMNHNNVRWRRQKLRKY